MKSVHNQWEALSSTGGRIGSATPDIVMIEVSDYECPFCRAAQAVVDSLVTRNHDVAVVLRHFPLSIHAHAKYGALASICAESSNDFPRINAVLFQTDHWQSASTLNQLAEDLGITREDEFLKCMSSNVTRKRLMEDSTIAELVGTKATPTFYTKHGTFVGLPTYQQLAELVRGK